MRPGEAKDTQSGWRQSLFHRHQAASAPARAPSVAGSAKSRENDKHAAGDHADGIFPAWPFRLGLLAVGLVLLALGLVLHFTVYLGTVQPKVTCFRGDQLTYNDVPIDFCNLRTDAAGGTQCGAPAADAFCEMQGLRYSAQWNQSTVNVNNTIALGNNAFGGQQTFSLICCDSRTYWPKPDRWLLWSAGIPLLFLVSAAVTKLVLLSIEVVLVGLVATEALYFFAGFEPVLKQVAYCIGLVIWTGQCFKQIWCGGTRARECEDRWLHDPLILLNVAKCLMACQLGRLGARMLGRGFGLAYFFKNQFITLRHVLNQERYLSAMSTPHWARALIRAQEEAAAEAAAYKARGGSDFVLGGASSSDAAPKFHGGSVLNYLKQDKQLLDDLPKPINRVIQSLLKPFSCCMGSGCCGLSCLRCCGCCCGPHDEHDHGHEGRGSPRFARSGALTRDTLASHPALQELLMQPIDSMMQDNEWHGPLTSNPIFKADKAGAQATPPGAVGRRPSPFDGYQPGNAFMLTSPRARMAISPIQEGGPWNPADSPSQAMLQGQGQAGGTTGRGMHKLATIGPQRGVPAPSTRTLAGLGGGTMRKFNSRQHRQHHSSLAGVLELGRAELQQARPAPGTSTATGTPTSDSGTASVNTSRDRLLGTQQLSEHQAGADEGHVVINMSAAAGKQGDPGEGLELKADESPLDDRHEHVKMADLERRSEPVFNTYADSVVDYQRTEADRQAEEKQHQEKQLQQHQLMVKKMAADLNADLVAVDVGGAGALRKFTAFLAKYQKMTDDQMEVETRSLAARLFNNLKAYLEPQVHYLPDVPSYQTLLLQRQQQLQYGSTNSLAGLEDRLSNQAPARQGLPSPLAVAAVTPSRHGGANCDETGEGAGPGAGTGAGGASPGADARVKSPMHHSTSVPAHLHTLGAAQPVGGPPALHTMSVPGARGDLQRAGSNQSQESGALESQQEVIHFHDFVSALRRAKRSLSRTYSGNLINAAKEAWLMFDKSHSFRLTEEDVRATLLEVYKSRRNLALSIRANQAVCNSLEAAAAFIIQTALVFVYMAIFGLAVAFSSGLDFFKTYVLAFSFIFGDSVKATFQSAIYLFTEHPFDVGDLLKIGDVIWQVEQFDLMYTTLISIAGEISTISNTQLISAQLVNLNRSKAKFEIIKIRVPTTISLDVLPLIKAAMKKVYDCNPQEYVESNVNVRLEEMESSQSLILAATWSYTFPPSEVGRMFNAKMAMQEVVIRTLIEQGVPAVPLQMDFNILSVKTKKD